MFYGEHRHSLDDKNRLIIPVKYRDVIQSGSGKEKCYITRGLEKCLFVFPSVEWELLREKVKNLSMMKANVRAFSRILFSGAHEAGFDRQGRIIIPQYLLDYAEIKKDAVIVGILNRFEIWDAAAWDTFSQQSITSFEKLAEDLVDL